MSQEADPLPLLWLAALGLESFPSWFPVLGQAWLLQKPPLSQGWGGRGLPRAWRIVSRIVSPCWRPLREHESPPSLTSPGHGGPGDLTLPSPCGTRWFSPTSQTPSPLFLQPWPRPCFVSRTVPWSLGGHLAEGSSQDTQRQSYCFPQSYVVGWPHSHLVSHTSSLTTRQLPMFSSSGPLSCLSSLPAPRSPSFSFLPVLSHF